MAAFQQYSASLLLDSINVPTIKTSRVFDEFIPNLNPFKTTQKSQNNQEGSSINVSGYECSCLEQQSTNKSSSLNNKKGIVRLSMADKAECANHVTQKCAHFDKKRKSRRGSSSTSANSEEVQQVMPKKQKQNSEAKKDNKVIEEPPKGYFHVRARRGQATDSHSLAERVRREKISERMKKLQALVPGCDKVTGKALMLDEIINYVQSLQNQVEAIDNGMASPMTLMQSTSNVGYNIDQPQAFTNTNALSSSTTSSATTSTYASSIVDRSAILLQQDPQQSLTPLQDAGSLCWGINDQQRQNIINQFGLLSGTNLYSCQ